MIQLKGTLVPIMQLEVSSSMISKLIPNFDQKCAELREVATSGFVLGMGMTWKGPEHLYSEFPEEWRKQYEQNHYYMADPVLLWHGTKIGFCRWSEISFPDLRDVLKEASKYGLSYGAVFSRKSPGGRCFLSVARHDREFEDEEIEIIEVRFQTWIDLVMDPTALTMAELDVLRAYRDGLGQREVAKICGISESAVKQRALKACGKLKAKNRTQAVAMAVARNYLE